MNTVLISLVFAGGLIQVLTSPREPALSYDAVAIHKSPPVSEHRPGAGISPGPQGGLRTHDTTALTLIAWAYNVQPYQIIGAPGWASNQGYDITFTPDRAEPPVAVPAGPKSSLSEPAMNRDLIRLQAVLRDRFALVLHSGTRRMPIYNLVQAKGGAKLAPHTASGPNSNLRARDGQIIGVDTTVERLADVLSRLLEHPVHDETHLSGRFDFKVVTEPDESLFTALPDQLGLKLESAKGPVQIYVVEKLNPPTEN